MCIKSAACLGLLYDALEETLVLKGNRAGRSIYSCKIKLFMYNWKWTQLFRPFHRYTVVTVHVLSL